MKSIKNIIVTISALALLASCERNDETAISQIDNQNGIKVVELSKTDTFQGNELGIYGLEFSGMQDITLRNKITKYRYSDDVKEHLSSYAITKEVSDLGRFDQISFGEIGFEKTNKMMEPKFLKQYRAKNGVGIKEKVAEVSETMFGKEQKFSLRTDSYEINESAYIPELIDIDNAGTFDETINRYTASRGGLSISYNVDAKNESGVALLLLWDGTTKDMSMQELASMNMEYKNKIVVFDPNDSGVLNVPQYALSKFPKNANLTMVLMRNNAKLIEKSGKKHYLVTGSEQYELVTILD
jgi:hypothetical protein